MATVGELTNKRVCGAGNVLGANNKKGCAFNFKDIKMLGVMSPDAKFSKGDGFNLQAFRDLQAAGKLEVFQGVDGVEVTGNDDTINTSVGGVNQVGLKGLYQFKLTFVEDLYFQAVLSSFSSFKGWYTFLADSAGNMLFTERTNGDLYSFSTGMLNAGKYVFGSIDLTTNSLEFQWTSRPELDLDFAFIDNASLDFNPLVDLEGVAQAEVSFISVPQALDTTLSIEAVYTRGGDDSIIVLTDISNWRVLVDGVEVTLLSASYTDGSGYTLTLREAVAVNNVVKVSINGIVDVEGDCLYKSNMVELVVVQA